MVSPHEELSRRAPAPSRDATTGKRSTWTLDTAHSTVGFSVRYMMLAKVHGAFTRWSATLELDDADVKSSRVTVKLDASSIDTREAQRDAHLRSPDFLDVAKYPDITFESRTIQSLGEDRVAITGPFTCHGVTRDITVDVTRVSRGEDPWGKQRIAFTGKTALSRKDFGVVYNVVHEKVGVLVADTIDVSLELQVVAAPA